MDRAQTSATSATLRSELDQTLLENPTLPGWRPEISLRRIRRISTYEVQESDLEALDRSMQSENQALGFASLSLGALISTGLSWIGAASLTPVSSAIYVAATLVLALASLNFSFTWIREKRARKSLLNRIKTQASLLQEESYKKA